MSKQIDEVEVDDEEAQEIIAEARHKQIQRSFAKLTSAVTESDSKIIAAAQKQTEAIGEFAESIKGIELNPTEIVSSLLQIREDIVASNNKLIETIETRLLPDTFTLNKRNNGETESVKVNYKPANQIKNK